MKKFKRWLGLFVCITIFAAIALGSGSTDSNSSVANSNNKKTETEANNANAEADTVVKESTKDNSTVHIGEEFGNNTITGMVTYANLDFKDYNDIWTTIDDGYKAIYLKIKMVNVSDKENYVSVGDFDCYADNIIVSAELISGGDDDYNANIEAGRSAMLGAMYVVPADTKSIELEYNPLGEMANRQIIIIQDENTTETIIEAENADISINSDSKDAANVVGIGDEFGNKTIKAVVLDADLNYKGYNDIWTKVDEGYKVIYIRINVTNISDRENYVSVGDFSCYVDDTIVDAELITGGNDDYNANIAAGRSAVLGAAYVVPSDANSIELEYDPIGESADRVIIKIQ